MGDAVLAGEKAARSERKAAETMMDQDDGKAMNAAKAAKIAAAKKDVQTRKAQARRVEQDLERSRKLRAAAAKVAANKTATASAGLDDSVPALKTDPVTEDYARWGTEDLDLGDPDDSNVDLMHLDDFEA